MKRKLLVGFILSSAIASSSFAIEIQNGKLISHIERHDPQLTSVVFKDNILAKNVLNFKRTKLQSDQLEQIQVTEMAGNEVGEVGRELIVQGENEVIIYNFTSTTKTYLVNTEFCTQVIASTPNSYVCASAEDKIQLDPTGGALINRVPLISLKFQQAGLYNSYISTYVTKADQEITSLYKSNSYGLINISDHTKK